MNIDLNNLKKDEKPTYLNNPDLDIENMGRHNSLLIQQSLFNDKLTLCVYKHYRFYTVHSEANYLNKEQILKQIRELRECQLLNYVRQTNTPIFIGSKEKQDLYTNNDWIFMNIIP